MVQNPVGSDQERKTDLFQALGILEMKVMGSCLRDLKPMPHVKLKFHPDMNTV